MKCVITGLSWAFEYEKKIKQDKIYSCGFRNIDGIDKKVKMI